MRGHALRIHFTLALPFCLFLKSPFSIRWRGEIRADASHILVYLGVDHGKRCITLHMVLPEKGECEVMHSGFILPRLYPSALLKSPFSTRWRGNSGRSRPSCFTSGLTMVNTALPCTWCCLMKEGARSCTQDSFYPGSTLLPLSQISFFNTLARKFRPKQAILFYLGDGHV